MNHHHIHHHSHSARRHWTVRVGLPLLLATSSVLAACGSDGDDADGAPSTTAAAPTTTHVHTPETTATPVPDTTTPDTATPDTVGVPGLVTITASNYAFEDVPANIPVGSTLAIKNVAKAELHEIVAFRLPDSETRTVGELMALPPDELTAAFGGPPRIVMLQMPGSSDIIRPVGDGTLGEPGRYVIICGIPTGADPVEYLTAAAASPGGPPQGVAGGPPHLVHGMYAEFTVG